MRSANVASVIESLLGRARVPGCSLAVVGHNGVRWSHSFGYADLVSGRRSGRSTAYHLFSATKLFTSTAVLQLAERGKLDIEASATTYLPDLPQLDEITLRHLLSHTSGLEDTLRAFLAVYFPGDDPPTTKSALQAYTLRPNRVPGKKVRYANVNYAVLGEVITRVSGLPYKDYIRDRVLMPLSSDAEFEVDAVDRARMARGYLRRWDPMRVLFRFLMPAVSRRVFQEPVLGGFVPLEDYNLSTASIGGLIGSVDSFAPFLESQLNGGGPILSQKMTERMQAMAAMGRAGVQSKTGVGLGWKIGETDGHPFLNHEGSGAGFTSELRLYPEEGLGMVILMNTSSMSRTMRAAHQICEAIRKDRDVLSQV